MLLLRVHAAPEPVIEIEAAIRVRVIVAICRVANDLRSGMLFQISAPDLFDERLDSLVDFPFKVVVCFFRLGRIQNSRMANTAQMQRTNFPIAQLFSHSRF